MTDPTNDFAPIQPDRGEVKTAELGGLQRDLTIDADEAERFLARLDTTTFCFRTFADRKDAKAAGRNYSGTFASLRERLIADNRALRGVFVVVNAGGQNAGSIARVRAVFADLDGAPLDPVLACELQPHIVAESSPDRFHAYWLVDGLALGDFKPVQHRIAQMFGGDESVDDLPRVMRLPGFIHAKGEPFRSRIIHMSDAEPYAAAVIMDMFPPLAARPSKVADKVMVGRHADVLKTSASAARKVAKGETTRSEAMTELRDMRDAGRWSRDVPDDELKRALDGALMKFTHNAWDATPAHGETHNACSHVANGHRIATHFAARALYVEGIGWHHRDSGRWQHDELAVRGLAQGLGKIIAAEAAGLAQWVADARDKPEREQREAAMSARFKWAGQSEQSSVIDASLRQAEPLLRCKAADMDAATDLLGMPNAVLDLRTVSWRPYGAEDRITKACAIDYDMHATAPRWQRFIAETFADCELADFVQRLAGYCLSGHRGEHLLPILHGSGANGKSVFLGTLQHVLGEYASTAAPGLLIRQPGSEHPTGLADLQGRRLVVVSETGEAGRMHEEQAKALTGGDPITARRMHRDFYGFKPTHQLILQTNHRPRVAGTDEGIWRRLRLIPFDRVVPAEQRDTKLAETLKAEAPGILTWCVEGWRRYQATGLTTPRAVIAASQDYRDASDVVGAFITEECELGSQFTAPASELYKAYVTWCEEAGERPRSQRDLGMRLSERGLEKGSNGIARRWRGIRLRTDGTDGYDAVSRFFPTREDFSRRNTDFAHHASVPSVAADYRRAKDGEP
jgi:putative DNA primase/helicase